MAGCNDPIKLNFCPAGPLWGRVPTQDQAGQPLADFMVLIPRFNGWPKAKQARAIKAIEDGLTRFDRQIVFADFNIKINLLWVSLRPEKGVMMAFIKALQVQVPEAVLIANEAEMVVGEAVTVPKKQPRLD